ncbi:MAG: hypothetical protein ACYS0G_14730 [Planctomycetota bacterium]
MRQHILKAIDEAQRPGDQMGIADPRGPALRLAAETIRLARLAASAHMILSARSMVEGGREVADPVAGQGRER